MASFPGGLFTAPTLGATMSAAPTHSTVHNNANGEIQAIEATLGVNPQGAFATVKAYIDSLPQGELAYAQVTAVQATLEGGVDLTGLTVTFTFAANRRIRLSGYLALQGSVANDLARVDIKESTTVLVSDQQVLSTSQVGFHPEIILTPSAGAHTYKLFAVRSLGAGTLSSAAGATNPAFILAEDIGAV